MHNDKRTKVASGKGVNGKGVNLPKAKDMKMLV